MVVFDKRQYLASEEDISLGLGLVRNRAHGNRHERARLPHELSTKARARRKLLDEANASVVSCRRKSGTEALCVLVNLLWRKAKDVTKVMLLIFPAKSSGCHSYRQTDKWYPSPSTVKNGGV